MAGKQAGDGLPANLAGMSKTQLYDIMCQMKALIEQNQQQARQILIQNPVLTRALFQAQIMLGMLQPPKAVPSAQPAASQNLQPATVPTTAPSSQGQLVQDQARNQQQSQPIIPVSSASVRPANYPPQTLPSHSLQPVQQPKVHVGSQSGPMSLPQSSQVPNMIPRPLHSAPQQPLHLQPPMPPASTQLQQSMQTTGIHQPLHPPIPPQPRAQMPAFPHQLHAQPSVGFQHPGAPQFHHSQPMFHPGSRPQANAGPPFMHNLPSLPNHMPPQSLNQMGGTHMRPEFNQAGSSVQAEKASPWIPGLPDNRRGVEISGPPPVGQMVSSNQPPHPAPLTPEMEKALLEKVMSLTQEQISMLPPDQRNQVLQLQQMMRH